MSIYSGIPLVTLQTRLTEAQTALHELLVGKKVSLVVTSDGKRVSFAPLPGDISKLKQYIAQLQTAIAVQSGQTVGGLCSVATWTR